MDDFEIIEVKRNETIHRFHCDDCGKIILESAEYDDGYYETPRKITIQHVKLIGDYCVDCGEKRAKEVIDFAKKMDFDIDYNQIGKY